MAAPTNRAPLDQARAALATSRDDLVDKIDALNTAERELLELQRTGDPAQAEQDLTTARDNLIAARTAERTARDTLLGAISSWLKDDVAPHLPLSPEDDVKRMEAGAPIVLFPVRMETRFDPPNAPTNLKVRIYPDEIFLRTHEKALTREEQAAGVAFHKDRDPADPGDEPIHKERWRDLVARFGSTRAAYIARALTPKADGGESSSSASGSDPGGGQIFPVVKNRPDHWTRPGEAVLPDRWVVVAYRGNVTRVFLGDPIREPLNVTPDPGLREDSELADLGNEFKIDNEVAWTVDFARALTAGMAVQIPLTAPEERSGGFDRLVVLGIKSSLDSASTAALLEELIDNHHYTRGLGLVPPGTPTNNTTGKPVPFPPDDPGAEKSFQIERNPPPLESGTPPDSLDSGDFSAFFQPFGLSTGVFRNIENATARNLENTVDMHAAVWPATLSYYLEEILKPVTDTGQPKFSAATLEGAFQFFTRLVKGSGPFPAFRIGSVPYGVLPVLSLNRWAARNAAVERIPSEIAGTLRVLREIWAVTASIPRIRRVPVDPYDPLVRLLAQDASSKTVQVRNGRGPITQTHTGWLTDLETAFQLAKMAKDAAAEARRIGQPTWQPRGFAFEWDKEAHDLDGPLVVDEPSKRALEPNFITDLAAAELEALRDDTVVAETRKPFLYMLLRHALLREYQRVALSLFPQPPSGARFPLFDLEHWFMRTSGAQEKTLFELLAAPAPPKPGEPPQTVFAAAKNDPGMVNFRKLFGFLGALSTEELHRVFSEALDVCSHRLDAWITALATFRLQIMRDDQAQAEEGGLRRPSHLGGYGWLENVRPGVHTLRDMGGAVGTVEIQPDNGGFIHAPSVAQGSAAALLRAGRLAGRLDGESKYAIDLSSERARRARRLVQEVRNGQPLAALLGYQIERGISDSGIGSLQATLHKLRNRFPLVANKAGDDPFLEVDTVAARSVVDGNLLLMAYKAGALDFANDPALPRPNTSAHTALVAQLERLKEIMDAVADLVYAEAVYQVVQADVPTAQANLDFLPHGQNPPEPEIVRADGGGIGVTHRVALLFAAKPAEAPGWPAAKSTARSAADPLLDAWEGQLLGDPREITATVSFKDSIDAPKTTAVKLSELGLRPLDVVALAHASPEANQGSLLDRRLLAKAFQSGWKEPLVAYTTSSTARPGSIPELLEVARAIGTLLAGARPLVREDLRTPLEAAQPDGPPQEQVEDLVARMVATRKELKETIEALDAAGSKAAALTRAAQFLPALFPPAGSSDTQLGEQAKGASAELGRRSDAVSRLLPDNSAPSLGPTDSIALLQEAYQVLFGADFVGLTGLGAPPVAEEIKKSLDARSTLLADDGALDRFLAQTARVREGVGRWRRLALYARALGATRARVDLVQLPHTPGETWVGASVPAAGGRLSVVLIAPTSTAAPPTTGAALNWSGLFVDQWVESVPRAERETGIGFHYDHPNAEAPQAVLVAVPSGTGSAWNWDELLATINETLDLTHIRSLEPRHLPLGQQLPAIYLASNTQNYNVSTTFARQLLRAVGRSL